MSQKYDIEIVNLTKVYKLRAELKEITALNKINLKVKKGEIFGLLGPNGAGKTTMVSILTTIIQPTNGYAKVLGYNILKNPGAIKEKIGLMLGGDMIYYRITGYRNLKYFCKLYGIKDFKTKIDEIVEKLDLKKWINQYVEKYSKGMKLKLALARVLIINPKILFLDEPMLGLDPSSVQTMIDILLDFKKTIFLTSHQMNIVEKICDRIAFLNKGNILKVDTQDNFKKILSDKIKIKLKIKNGKDALLKCLKSLDFISKIEDINEDIFFIIESEEFYPELLKNIKDFTIIQFNQIEPSLDEIFINLSK